MRRPFASGDTLCAAPLCRIARWKSPRAAGAPSSAPIDIAPADSPKSVTFSGSPPSREACSRTHASAAIWSSRPKFAPISPARQQIRLREEAERAEPVVHRDDHRVAAPRERRAVEERQRAGTRREAAAVQPHQHGTARAASSAGVQTCSVRQSSSCASPSRPSMRITRLAALGRAWPIARGVAHAAPRAPRAPAAPSAAHRPAAPRTARRGTPRGHPRCALRGSHCASRVAASGWLIARANLAQHRGIVSARFRRARGGIMATADPTSNASSSEARGPVVAQLGRGAAHAEPVVRAHDGPRLALAADHARQRVPDDAHLGRARRPASRWRVRRPPTANWFFFALALLGLVLAHAANNMINDYFDLAGGVDSARLRARPVRAAPDPLRADLEARPDRRDRRRSTWSTSRSSSTSAPSAARSSTSSRSRASSSASSTWRRR